MRHFSALTLFAIVLIIAGCASKEEVTPGVEVTKDSTGRVSKIETKDATTTISDNGKDAKVEGKEGTLEVKGGITTATDKNGNTAAINISVTEADMGGTPFYPGSTEKPGGLKSEVNGKKTAMSQRETSDEPGKVIEFYKSKLGKPESESSMNTIAVAKWKKGSQEIDVNATKDGSGTTVAVIVQG